MGISPTSVTQIWTRETAPAYESIKNLLHSIPELNAQWLITGTGSMLSRALPSHQLAIVGDIAAGNPTELTEFPDIGFIPLADIHSAHPDKCLAMRVSGDSMAPYILHNDIVIIDIIFDLWDLDGQIVAVKIDTETTLKHISIDDANRQCLLIPFNHKHYKPIVLNEYSPDTIILGRLISLTRII